MEMIENKEKRNQFAQKWEFRFPYSHVWVKPQVITKEINPLHAVEQIQEQFDSVYGIEIVEASDSEQPCEVLIYQLIASCPFCAAEKDRILNASSFDKMMDWSEDSIKKLIGKLRSNSVLDHSDFVPYIACLDNSFFDHEDEDKSGSSWQINDSKQNGFGIDLAAFEAHNPNQMHLNLLDTSPIKHVTAPSNDLVGIYCCPTCGERFGISMCDENPNAKSEHERKLKKAFSLLTTSSVAEADSMNQGNTIIATEEDRVIVSMTVADQTYELIFNTELGSIYIDGVDMGNIFPMELFDHPLVYSGLFENRDIVFAIYRLLPDLPEGIEWGAVEDNLKSLILANRFVGYPSDFYTKLKHGNDFYTICSINSGLPRKYEDIEIAFKMTGLPNKKSIKRRLFANPILLFDLLDSPGIPFDNPDIICRFLDEVMHHDLMREMGLLSFAKAYGGRRCIGWRMIARLKGEDTLLNFISTHEHEEIRKIERALGGGTWMYSPQAMEVIRKTPMNKMAQSLEILVWKRANPGIKLDQRYEYSEAEMRLEADIQGFQFRLPTCAYDFVKAGQELHNCMGELPQQIKYATCLKYILVSKGKGMVGGIAINDEYTVVEARSFCNDPLEIVEGLEDAFRQWCIEKELNAPDFENPL